MNGPCRSLVIGWLAALVLALLVTPREADGKRPRKRPVSVTVKWKAPANPRFLDDIDLPVPATQVTGLLDHAESVARAAPSWYALPYALRALKHLPATGSAAQSALRDRAVRFVAKQLAHPDWNGDGCPDFGSKPTSPACPALDDTVRAQLQIAGLVAPPPSPAERLERVAQRVAEREAVRKVVDGLPHRPLIVMATVDALVERQELESLEAAFLLLEHRLQEAPLDRDAEAWLRQQIQVAYYLVEFAGLRSYPIDPSGTAGSDARVAASRIAARARRRHLDMFGPGSAWHVRWGRDPVIANDVARFQAFNRLVLTYEAAREVHRLEGHNEPQAEARYLELVQAFEAALNDADLDAAMKYDAAWELAHSLESAGKKCDAQREGGNHVVMADGVGDRLAAWPQDQVVHVQRACGHMRRAAEAYRVVRDWQGPRRLDYRGEPADFTDLAAERATVATLRILVARGALPIGCAEHLPASQVPGMEPNQKAEDAEIDRARKQRGIVRIRPKALDPAVVAWLLDVDAEVAGNANQHHALPKALEAAKLLYRNRHFDPNASLATMRTPAAFWSARKRLWAVVRARKHGLVEAAAMLLKSYALENDDAGLMSEWLRLQEFLPEDSHHHWAPGLPNGARLR